MPTMNDVAKLAGVSRGTVSNYVNGFNVKSESKKKIQEAIETLNYVPNMTARELKMNRSNLVVFILPTTHTPFFAELTHDIQERLKQSGFKMILCNSNNDISEELDYIQMAKEQKVAGIITISYSDLAPYLTTNLPIVSIENKLTDKIPCVSPDNYQGGWLAAEILSKKGAKQLLLITRSTDKTAINYGRRSQGFIDYCKENGIECELFDSQTHEKEFYPELKRFLNTTFSFEKTYDGIFTVSDQYADFTWNILEKMSYKLPDDIQLVGYDGGKMYPEQERFVSSIRQPIENISECSVTLLKKLLANEVLDSNVTCELPLKFIDGQTTKK